VLVRHHVLGDVFLRHVFGACLAVLAPTPQLDMNLQTSEAAPKCLSRNITRTDG